MRIHFSDLVGPKQAAKYLICAAAELNLATVHEALARALGYRDWHELSISAQPSSPAEKTQVGIEDALLITLELADALAFSGLYHGLVCNCRLS